MTRIYLVVFGCSIFLAACSVNPASKLASQSQPATNGISLYEKYCASCHRPQNAFTDDSPTSSGVDGIFGERNSMPIFNLAWNYNERFAWDSYRRFIQMYGDVVLGMKPESKEEEEDFDTYLTLAASSSFTDDANGDDVNGETPPSVMVQANCRAL